MVDCPKGASSPRPVGVAAGVMGRDEDEERTRVCVRRRPVGPARRLVLRVGFTDDGVVSGLVMAGETDAASLLLEAVVEAVSDLTYGWGTSTGLNG
jgi:hypothetical protein